MESIELTWFRALKVWWSYSWRAMVLTLIVMVPLELVVVAFIRTSMQPGTTDGQALRMAGIMAVVWPVLMAAIVAVQVQAMRWMLNKARWSDFRVSLLPRDSG